MKYADSFEHTETITATDQTTYSEWFDISWANELHSFLRFHETGTVDTESILVTLERFRPLDMNPATVIAHAAKTSNGTAEIYARHYYDGGATGADNKLGMRVRYKFVSSGSFGANNTITMTMSLYAKRN